MSEHCYSFNHVSVIVNDVSKALEFYHGVLGIEVDMARPDLGYPGAWLKIGSQQIHLLELNNPDSIDNRPQHGGRDRHFALNVNDLSALRLKLDGSNINYTMSKSGRNALFCRDYDGNAVELIEAVVL